MDIALCLVTFLTRIKSADGRRHRNMIKAIINGQPREFTEGISVLAALSSVGIEVPTLCHDQRLKPIGSCRLCLVQVEGRPHPITACDHSLVDGMVISTHTAALEA